MANVAYESEGRIVSCLQKWLDRYWRSGTVSANAKASLCNSLLATIMSSHGECGAEFRSLTDALYDTLENIRHVKNNCTTRFMNALVEYIGKANATLEGSDATCPRIIIPLRDGRAAGTDTTVRAPEECAKTGRTPVPAHDVTPLEIDTKGLGETVVRITVLDGKVTCDITQKRK